MCVKIVEKNGEVERTFKIMDEMYEAKISPTVVSFCSAISACGKVRRGVGVGTQEGRKTIGHTSLRTLVVSFVWFGFS